MNVVTYILILLDICYECHQICFTYLAHKIVAKKKLKIIWASSNLALNVEIFLLIQSLDF